MKAFTAAIAALGVLTATSAMAAGRAPTEPERTAIESALKQAGFTQWVGIELDSDGTWDVDDAKHTDGKVYDLALKKDSYEILNKVIEE